MTWLICNVFAITEVVGIDTFSALEEKLNNMPLPILGDGAKFTVEQPNNNDQCAKITFPRPGNIMITRLCNILQFFTGVKMAIFVCVCSTVSSMLSGLETRSL